MFTGLLTASLWAIWLVFVSTGTMTVFLAGAVGCRYFVRSVRRLIIWLDEEDRARRALQRRRLLQSYNQARDEEQEIKAKIREESKEAVIRIYGKTLKHKTVIRQRCEQALLDALPEETKKED